MDIKDVRRLYDIKVILGMQRKNQIVCPLPQHPHHDYTPSFSVFNAKGGVQLFKCHGSCGLGGDVIDLTGYMKVPGYNPKNKDHIKRAISLLSGFEYCPPKPPKKKSILTNDMADRYALKSQVVEYAQKRGLNPETLKRFKIGQLDTSVIWMTIPTFTGSKLTMMKMRNLNAVGKKDRFRNLEGSESGIFNVNEVKNKTEPVLILKAEIPSMLATQYGFLSCAPNAGENAFQEEWLKELSFSKKRVVVGDNDKDPKVREKMTAFMKSRAEGLRAELRFPPENYKDIDEFMLAEPNTATELIKGWLK
jgi:hypothetical protein